MTMLTEEPVDQNSTKSSRQENNASSVNLFKEQAKQSEKDRTLFCINIDQKCSEDILYELFLQAGPLDNIVRKNDRNGKLICLITYKYQESCDYAIQLLNGIKLYGQSLKVQQSQQNTPNLPNNKSSSNLNNTSSSIQNQSNTNTPNSTPYSNMKRSNSNVHLNQQQMEPSPSASNSMSRQNSSQNFQQFMLNPFALDPSGLLSTLAQAAMMTQSSGSGNQQPFHRSNSGANLEQNNDRQSRRDYDSNRNNSNRGGGNRGSYSSSWQAPLSRDPNMRPSHQNQHDNNNPRHQSQHHHHHHGQNREHHHHHQHSQRGGRKASPRETTRSRSRSPIDNKRQKKF